jgi:hypothetical protein
VYLWRRLAELKFDAAVFGHGRANPRIRLAQLAVQKLI